MDVLVKMDNEVLLENLYSSNFTVFLGNFGRGKSISLTYLAVMSALLNKRKVVMSNTPIYDLSSYGIEFIPLISTSQFTENMKDIQIVIDELQKTANSRKSLSIENSFVTEFSTDVRKFNQGICATSQFNNTYDVRLCDNTEVNIVPQWKYEQKKNRKDFSIYWNLFFLDTNETETIELDMDTVKNMYDTTYKPFKLVVNHEDFISDMYDKHKESYVDRYITKNNALIHKAEGLFNLEMENRY